jgi:hypothetical protein
MGNLVEITPIILVNAVTAADFGMYTESLSGDSVNMLMFKKLGFTIPKTTNGGFIKSSAVAGQVKISYFQLNDLEPADTSKYNYGITIDPVRKNPGIESVPYVGAKTYGGERAVAVSGGLITAAAQALIAADIVDQCYSDPNAIVDIGHAILLTTWNAASQVTVNGDALAAGATAAAVAVLITALDDVTAYALSLTEILVVSTAGVPVITVDAGTIVVTTTVLLGITADSVNTSFTPKFYNAVKQSESVQASIFPFLTNDDVKRQFANYGNHGVFKGISGVDNVIDGATYTRYTFTFETAADASVGAGKFLTHRKQIVLYVLTSAIDDDVFLSTDLDNDAPANPDNTFDELLAAWIA